MTPCGYAWVKKRDFYSYKKHKLERLTFIGLLLHAVYIKMHITYVFCSVFKEPRFVMDIKFVISKIV